MDTAIHDLLTSIWKAGVAAVNGRTCVADWLSRNPDFAPTHLAAIGKAAPEMALAALPRLASSAKSLVITKAGHALPELAGLNDLSQLESSHPVPGQTSLEAGRELLAFIRELPERSDLMLLVSGGASALVEVLEGDSTLADLARLNADMLGRPLDIVEMNRRRREISRIKGGRLLSHARCRSVTVLAISDVPGDDIAVIGSGLGQIDLCPANIRHVEIVASNTVARNAAAGWALGQDIPVLTNEESLHGMIGKVADRCAQAMRDGPPGLHVFGGEPFLSLPENPGDGGRNQALALEVAKRIDGCTDLAFLAAGTDGGDGPGDAAGGLVDGDSWRATPGGDSAIAGADSGTWLRASGGRFVTGPTGTNVMDLAIGYRCR